MAVADVFADTGILALQEGSLDDGLRLLSARMELAGAGTLMSLITDMTCWAVTHGPDVTGCRCEKGTPDPKPIQPPKPPSNPKPGK